MDNIKEYVSKFTTFGIPIDYKGLKIKPVLVKDAELFLDVVEVFRIEKNKIPSIEIIQMSYLEFLMGMIAINQDYLNAFLALLSLTLGMQYDESYKKEGDTFAPNELLSQKINDKNSFYYINGWDIEVVVCNGKASINIMGTTLTSSEFDVFRHIVLFQNIADYDDIEMSDDFRRVVEQYYALKFKGIHDPTLEEKMLAIIMSTSYTIESLAQVPLRSFDKLFDYSVKKADYIATKPLEPHLKEGCSIDHWVFYPERDRFADVFGDPEEVTKKVTNT